jgi:hypothetical protein
MAARAASAGRSAYAQWRRYLPPHARYVAFRPPSDAFRRWLPLPNQRLPEFRKRVELPALPGWIVYERGADAN